MDYDGEAKLLEDLVLGDEGKDECFQSYQGSRSKEKTIQYSLAQHHDYPLDNSEICIQGLKEREKKTVEKSICDIYIPPMSVQYVSI